MRHLFWCGRTTRRWLAMAGEAAIGAEQSSEEAAVERCEGEAEWVVASSTDFQAHGPAHIGRRRPAATGAERLSTRLARSP
jgi:hypothetical protein